MQLTLGNGVLTALFRGGHSECKSPPRGCLLSRRHQRTHDLRSRADIPESLLKPVSTSDKGSCPLSCSSDCNDADGTLSDMSNSGGRLLLRWNSPCWPASCSSASELCAFSGAASERVGYSIWICERCGNPPHSQEYSSDKAELLWRGIEEWCGESDGNAEGERRLGKGICSEESDAVRKGRTSGNLGGVYEVETILQSSLI